jgi:hypothetical protein
MVEQQGRRDGNFEGRERCTVGTLRLLLKHTELPEQEVPLVSEQFVPLSSGPPNATVPALIIDA